MAGAKSKRIGKAGETNTKNWLNNIFSDYEVIETEKLVEFRRVIGSGAHGHLVEQMPLEVRVSLAGDVYGPTKWPWIIETKKRSDDSVAKILKNEKHEFHEWTEQVYNEAQDFGKKSPMLVMDFGGKTDAWVAMHDRCINKLWKWKEGEGKPPRIKINAYHEKLFRWEPWVIMHWNEWEKIVVRDLESKQSYLLNSAGIRRVK